MDKNPGTIIGIALIGGGALLFLDNLGILPFRATSLFWPLAFLVYGAVFLYNSRSTATAVWGVCSLVAGCLLLLNTVGILHVTIRTLWPLALIAAGVTMLLYRMRWQHLSDRFASTGGTFDRLQEFAIFSGIKRKVDSPSFEGGEISTMFGGIEIDLRRAGISPATKQVIIEANAAFGGIEIRVPETWRVSLQGTAVFGGYEDKTVPPRPEPGVDIPLLIVRGGTAFGGVSIQN
ncbi:MAG: cell wall-active antibiotics response protein [Acidobacteriota bacterium]|nr:cell wall-active antibiotics response protein [Acidobacteriota bacterium]